LGAEQTAADLWSSNSQKCTKKEKKRETNREKAKERAGKKERIFHRQFDYGTHLKAEQRDNDWVFASNLVKGVEMGVHQAISLQLQHFQRLADAHLKQTGQYKEPITHTVLIVPSDFTTEQREVYSQLAQAAGLTVVP